MGLLSTLKELQETEGTDRVAMEDLQKPPEKEEKEEPKVKIPEEKEEIAEPEDEGDVIEAKKEKSQVKGYQGRKIKEYEAKDKEKDEQILRERERADRLEKALLERTPVKAEEKPAVDSEPDMKAEPDKWVEWTLRNGVKQTEDLKKELQNIRIERAYDAASAELTKQEQAYAKENPAYTDAVDYITTQEIARQKILNPKVNEVALRRKLDRERIQVAAHFESIGKDPVEGLYQLMLNSGYSPKEEAEEKDEGKNFDAVKKNKAKSATSLSAGGKTGSVEAGPESARKLTMAEFSKLSKDQKDRIFRDKR